jgi:hypothetical protein
MARALGCAEAKGNLGSNMAEERKDDWTDIAATVVDAFANQLSYCKANDAPLTGRIVSAIAQLLGDPDPGPFIARIRDWPGSALADGLPLRAVYAVRGLYLAGKAPQLAPIYAGEPANDVALVREVLREHGASLVHWLDGPPQTNEAGRSSNFIAAMLLLAARGYPARFECLEIGSSAGINLMIDRYRYDLGGVIVGADEPVMRFAPEWRGPPPPPGSIEIVSARGCDVSPLDLTDPEQALRLKAFVWPEHAERFARLEAAIAAAETRRPDLVKMHAADFVEEALARPQAQGTTRVLMHSIVWQYLPENEKQRITAAMETAGARASTGTALAWITVEADREVLSHAMRLRAWPGGASDGSDGSGAELIAASHAHGAWIDWRAGSG